VVKVTAVAFTFISITMKKIYCTPEVKPLKVALERGFAMSVEGGVDTPSFENVDVSNNWK
jgi:hypothetical protein